MWILAALWESDSNAEVIFELFLKFPAAREFCPVLTDARPMFSRVYKYAQRRKA